ncbi:MAG: glycoside hydrolase family 26 protein [Bacteroides sp.]|nr:glycoside hydrolase family 26 protein [Eubacterium sp.]MCM1417427.1 glycoside hydrolase family 26 protein [Roseburia sp.]MCM1461606.1 glycoside hydrolase family 26 protein [Bacteroides sp.]
MKHLKKITALLLALSLLASCGNEAADSADQTTPAETDSPTSDDASAGSETNTAVTTLSNPVAVDENGDVDMEVALAYETDFDALLKSLDKKTVAEGETVSNQTNEKTQALYDWLRENYGKNIISAQQVSGKKQTEDLVYYLESEDLPAIKGFDFIFTTTNTENPSEWTDMAIEWHTKSNGIVAFCWHWNVPIDVNQDKESTAKAFYSENIKNFSLKNAVTPGTAEYEVVVHDIDLIAIELQKLEAAGVPVLWRPLHEASGAWFWWGVANREIAEGEYYQKLWYMIYDRLENYHKLTNLIWVWNGQNKHTQVHPNTYDISGIDVYPSSVDHSAQEKKYSELQAITDDGKMLALSEVGYIPDPDEAATTNWLFFMPWNGEFIYKETNVYGIPKINTEKMDAEFLKKVMTHEKVITWSELPDWGGTERNLPESIEGNLFFINQTRAEEGE